MDQDNIDQEQSAHEQRMDFTAKCVHILLGVILIYQLTVFEGETVSLGVFYYSVAKIALTAYAIFCSIQVVPTETVAVTRLVTGLNGRVLYPGVHFLIPLLESSRRVHWSRVVENARGDLTEQTFDGDGISTRDEIFDVEPIEATTKNRVQVAANFVAYIKIVNPFKAVTAVSNLWDVLVNRLQTACQTVISTYDYHDAVSQRDSICAAVKERIRTAYAEYGVCVNDLQLQSIDAEDDDVRRADQDVVVAERHAAARRLRADATRYEVEAQAAGEQKLMQAMRDSGLTNDDIREVYRAKGAAAMARSGVVDVPGMLNVAGVAGAVSGLFPRRSARLNNHGRDSGSDG